MRFFLPAFFLVLSLPVFGAAPVKRKPAAKKTASSQAAGKRTTTTRRKTTSSGALAGVTGPRNHQAGPTPERYKEIQQALAAKGYLKSEPNGVWDSESADAMRRFQAEKKLDPSGKINAPSLIGLGLGPQAPGALPAMPAAQAPAPGSPPTGPR